jgi:hypothetical protein
MNTERERFDDIWQYECNMRIGTPAYAKMWREWQRQAAIIADLQQQLTEANRREGELQRVVADQLLINPKEKIEIKFSDEAQAKAMVAVVTENRTLKQQNAELVEEMADGQRRIKDLLLEIKEANTEGKWQERQGDDCGTY